MRWHWPPENSWAAAARRRRGRSRPPRAPRRPWSSRSLFGADLPDVEAARRTMSRIRRRGLSDEIGSWKIIWSRGAACAAAPRRAAWSGRRRRSGPIPRRSAGAAITARPVVDLPHPDSPTSPSVSPGATSRLTSETACTRSPACPIGNSTTRSSTRSRTSSLAVGGTDRHRCPVPSPSVARRPATGEAGRRDPAAPARCQGERLLALGRARPGTSTRNWCPAVGPARSGGSSSRQRSCT